MPEPRPSLPRIGAVAATAVLMALMAACGAIPRGPGPKRTPAPTSSSAGPTVASSSARPTAASSPATPTTTPTAPQTPSPAAGWLHPRPLQLVGLGDSVPAADACGCQGFLEQSADELGRLTGRGVRLHNDAVDGWTTSSVLQSLRSGAERRDLASGADLVVIEAGANDLPLSRITDPACQPVQSSPCFRPTLTAVGSALTTAVRLIRRIDPHPRPTIVLMGYWNVSVDGVRGRQRGSTYLRKSRALTLAFNRVVRTVAAQTRTIYVDAYTPLLGPDGGKDPSPYLLGDGDHPNRAGYQLLVRALIARLEQTGAITALSAER